MGLRGIETIRPAALATIIFFAGNSISAHDRDLIRTGGEGSMPARSIEAVLAGNTDAIMSIPGVVGIAQSECAGAPCIKVYVTKKTTELLGRIPARIENYPVVVEESGELRAL